MCGNVYTDTAQDGAVYAGGMMLSGGVVDLQHTFDKMNGWHTGVGGRLFFMPWRGIRVGIMGGTGKMRYGDEESRFQYNHNAMSLEWGFSLGRFIIAAGLTGGRSQYYILHKNEVTPEGVITAREYQDAVFAFSPVTSLEFTLSGRLRAAVVVDYPVLHIEDHRHGGLRVGAGVLFVK